MIVALFGLTAEDRVMHRLWAINPLVAYFGTAGDNDWDSWRNVMRLTTSRGRILRGADRAGNGWPPTVRVDMPAQPFADSTRAISRLAGGGDVAAGATDGVLPYVEETVWTSHGEFALSCNEIPGAIYPRGFQHLRAFNVDPFPEMGLSGRRFYDPKIAASDAGENTVCLSYSLLTGEKSVTLEIKALLALCGIHELMYQWNSRLAAEVKRYGPGSDSASCILTPDFFAHDGEFRSEPHWKPQHDLPP